MIGVVDRYHSDAIDSCTLDSFVHTASCDDEAKAVISVQVCNYGGFVGDLDAWPGVDPAVANAIKVLRKPCKTMGILSSVR